MRRWCSKGVHCLVSKRILCVMTRGCKGDGNGSVSARLDGSVCAAPILFAALTGWGSAPAAPGCGICDALTGRCNPRGGMQGCVVPCDPSCSSQATATWGYNRCDSLVRRVCREEELRSCETKTRKCVSLRCSSCAGVQRTPGSLRSPGAMRVAPVSRALWEAARVAGMWVRGVRVAGIGAMWAYCRTPLQDNGLGGRTSRASLFLDFGGGE